MSRIQVQFNRDQFRRMAQKETFQAVFAASLHMQGKIQETLAGQRSGRPYRVPGTKVTYTASAPGEAPAVRLGDLRRSINYKIEQEADEVIGRIGSELDYGLYLERGTLNIAPRPWLAPTFDRETDNVKRILSEPW